jgi:haloacetate dehalogenase
MEDLYGDLVPLWEPWVAGPITRARIDSGHHMAEENPAQLAQVLADFLEPLVLSSR